MKYRLCGVLLLLPALVRAEALSLPQLIDNALHHDPRISEQEKLVGAARALLQEAQGSDNLIYDVNAFIGLTTQVKDGFFEQGAPSTPRSDRYAFDGLSTWSGLQFSLIKPLYTFGKIENYEKAAESNIEIKREDVTKQRASTVVDVSRAYYGYLTARDTRYLLEDVARRLDNVVKLARQWLDSGTNEIRQSDLYALQAAQALVGNYLAKAQAIEQVALDGLKVLTGIGLDGELEISDKHVTPVSLPEQSLDDLKKNALEQRPEMLQLQAGLAARRSLVAAKQAEKRPNVYAGIVGAAAYSPNRASLDSPFIYDPFNDYGATPLLGIQWQWQSGVQPAHVAQAQAELDALVEKSSFARQGIPFEVAEQYHQVMGHYESVQKLSQGSRAARRWMISTYADFEAGVQKAEKVLTAFQGYVMTHSDYLSAVNDYNMHVVQLRYVTGDIP